MAAHGEINIAESEVKIPKGECKIPQGEVAANNPKFALGSMIASAGCFGLVVGWFGIYLGRYPDIHREACAAYFILPLGDFSCSVHSCTIAVGGVETAVGSFVGRGYTKYSEIGEKIGYKNLKNPLGF